MKLLTLNTHSYIEKDTERNIEIFTDTVLKLRPDIIALQEINQRKDAPPTDYSGDLQLGITLKEDNYGLRLSDTLAKKGCKYNFVWLGIKQGFEIFDEGLCFLSLNPIKEIKAFQISKCSDPLNWKKRMVLGIMTNEQWFYNVHMGRWDDSEEPFKSQWDELISHIDSDIDTWLMGDFNAPSHIKKEGYDYVLSSGWYDTYTLSKQKDDGYTAFGAINGWEDKKDKKRIDYIFTNKQKEIDSSFTIFNGVNEKIISDHSGIIITC